MTAKVLLPLTGQGANLKTFLTEARSSYKTFCEVDPIYQEIEFLKAAGISNPRQSLQTEAQSNVLPQSSMHRPSSSNADLISAFMSSMTQSPLVQENAEKRAETDALLLKQQRAEYENALQMEYLRQADQEKEKLRL